MSASYTIVSLPTFGILMKQKDHSGFFAWQLSGVTNNMAVKFSKSKVNEVHRLVCRIYGFPQYYKTGSVIS